jgi:modulator of FtsH protease HflK
MKGDHRSYARATTTSLIGLGLQLLIGLTLLIYSTLGKDGAAFSASVHVLASSIIWIMLAIVFDQHRRERLEALEAEALEASAARESSVFGTSSDDLRVNAKRLTWMYKVLVPGMSLLAAVVLIGFGVLRYWQVTRVIGDARENVAAGDQAAQTMIESYSGLQYQGWAISLGLAIAVLGFIFARYTSGMSRSPMWVLLRAGAATAVAASLIGLAMGLAQFAEALGAVRFGRWMLMAIPIFSIVLGVEIILNFLLQLYRPRKPGEWPKSPADSWLLASVAAPDQIAKNIGGAITYQFGVDVTGSWAYRLLSRSIGGLALIAIVVVWLMTMVTVVGPDERAIVVRMGEKKREVGPGFYIDAPWPITRIERTKVTQLRSVDLATGRAPKEVSHILWTNEHKVETEVKVLVRPSSLRSSDGRTIASETSEQAGSLMVVEVPLFYRINDLAKFEALATPNSRDDFIRAIARREMTRYLTTLDEEQILGAKRAEASATLKQRVADALAAANSGVEVVFCAIEGVHPPRGGSEAATAKAYEALVVSELRAAANIELAKLDATKAMTKAAGSEEQALQLVDAQRKLLQLQESKAPAKDIQAAEQQIESLIAASGGEIGSMLARARADRWTQQMTARGDAESYEGRLTAFNANRSLYFATRRLDVLRSMMRDSRVYIVDETIPNLRLEYDLKDLTTGGFTFSDPRREK